MNAIRDTIYPNGEWRNKEGRPKGSGTKEEVVKDWREKNPEGRKVDCRRETKLDQKQFVNGGREILKRIILYSSLNIKSS